MEGIFPTVSMIALIVNPEKYHKKEVLIVGFYSNEFEGHSVYLHRDDYIHGIRVNALAVKIQNKVASINAGKSDLKYVLLKGIFDAEYKGTAKAFSGSIAVEGIYPDWEKFQRMFRRD